MRFLVFPTDLQQNSQCKCEPVEVVGAINEGTFVKFVRNVRLNLSDQNTSSQDDQLRFSRMTAVSLEEYKRYQALGITKNSVWG